MLKCDTQRGIFIIFFFILTYSIYVIFRVIIHVSDRKEAAHEFAINTTKLVGYSVCIYSIRDISHWSEVMHDINNDMMYTCVFGESNTDLCTSYHCVYCA